MAYPIRGSMDPTPEEVQARILAHARGESHFAIASRYKVSVQASKQFKQRHLPEIEAKAKELDGVVLDRTSELWVNDVVAQAELRQHLAEDILRRRDDPDLPARDVSRYNRDIDQLLYKAAELAGLIKQRTQAEVEVTAPFRLGEVLAFGADGQLHEVVDTPDSESELRRPGVNDSQR